MAFSRRTVVALVAAALSTTVVVGSAASAASSRGNRFEATFAETRLAALDRVADLGIRQTILSGTGTVEGFGAANEIAAVSQDHAVTPCGPGSSTSTILRRIVVAAGTLVVKTLAHRCPALDGVIVATGRYEVDGAASTGVFAGAWGRGTERVEIPPPPATPTATISGKLHLVEP